MFGSSRVEYEVFTLPKTLPEILQPKVEIDTQLFPLKALTHRLWNQLIKLQGHRRALYLKWRYGSSDTYILMAFIQQLLAHVEWIVPAKKIRGRYPFVSDNSYSIISCLTYFNNKNLSVLKSG